MSRLKVALPGKEIPTNGKQVSFKAPCSCSDITCIVIDGEDYALVDACNGSVAGTANRWVAGALISVMLDVDNKKAFVLNASPTTTYNALLRANGWTGSVPYTQTITVPGLLADDEPFLNINLEGITNATTGTNILDNWVLVGRAAVTANNKLIAYCYDEKPSVDLPITLKVVR